MAGVVGLALLTQMYSVTIPVLVLSRGMQILDVFSLGSVGAGRMGGPGGWAVKRWRP